MIYLIAICVIIVALGAVFDSDEAVLIGGILSILFGGFYLMYEEKK